MPFALSEAQIARIHDVLGVEYLLHPLQGHGVTGGPLIHHRGQFTIRSGEEGALIQQGEGSITVKSGNSRLFCGVGRVIEESEFHLTGTVMFDGLDIDSDIAHGITVLGSHFLHDFHIFGR